MPSALTNQFPASPHARAAPKSESGAVAARAAGRRGACRRHPDRGSWLLPLDRRDPSENEVLRRIARRLFWWKPPEAALRDRLRFAARVMTCGNWEAVQPTREKLGDSLFLQTLHEAPSGVFDGPSWASWHGVFGVRPVPSLPRRKLP